MTSLLKTIRLPLFFAAVILFFVNERYLSFEDSHSMLQYLAIGLGLVAAILPLIIAKRVKAEGRHEEAHSFRMAFWWQLAVVVGFVVYLLYLGNLPANDIPETFGQKALLAGWLLLIGLGIFSGVGVEMVLPRGGSGPLAESNRVAKSAGFWLLIGLVLAILACVNYIGLKRNATYDFSYFKVTKPSESTEKLLPGLEKDLTISMFYPANNQVKRYLSEYFEKLADVDPKVKAPSYHDKDIEPKVAEQFEVNENGQVVLEYDGRREKLPVSIKLDDARSKLKKLDQIFQTAFLKLTTKRKVVYFTRGHGELDWLNSSKNPFERIEGLRKILKNQNFDVKKLTSQEGALNGIPEDAAVVVIVRPTEPFSVPEAQFLREYIEKGGSALIYLDVDKMSSKERSIIKTDTGMDPLMAMLKAAGITYDPTLLVNEKQHSIYTRSKADNAFLFTNGFSGKAKAVATLFRFDDRLHVSTYNSGSLILSDNKASKWRHQAAIRSLPTTFVDHNGNYTFDEKGKEGSDGKVSPKERRKQYDVMSVSTLQKDRKAHFIGDDPRLVTGKLIVMSDASAASDALLQNIGNQTLVVDQFRWLAGDSKTPTAATGAGIAETEEDVKINHSRAKGLWVFHGSIFSVPLLILLMGYLANRPSRRKPRHLTKKKEA